MPVILVMEMPLCVQRFSLDKLRSGLPKIQFELTFRGFVINSYLLLETGNLSKLTQVHGLNSPARQKGDAGELLSSLHIIKFVKRL